MNPMSIPFTKINTIQLEVFSQAACGCEAKVVQQTLAFLHIMQHHMSEITIMTMTTFYKLTFSFLRNFPSNLSLSLLLFIFSQCLFLTLGAAYHGNVSFKQRTIKTPTLSNWQQTGLVSISSSLQKKVLILFRNNLNRNVTKKHSEFL